MVQLWLVLFTSYHASLALQTGGEPLGGIKKKKKKKSKAPADGGEHAEGPPAEGLLDGADVAEGVTKLRPVTTTAGKAAKPGAVSILSGKNYEEEFASEIQKGQTGQKKSAPWGSSFVQAPKILHGKYSSPAAFPTASINTSALLPCSVHNP